MRSNVLLALLAIAAICASQCQADAFRFTVVEAPGTPEGINNAGQIATSQGILNRNGVFTPIWYPGATDSHVYGINDLGQVVGSFEAGGCNKGFFGSAGSFTAVDYGTCCDVCGPDAAFLFSIGLNNSGLIAGSYQGSSAESQRASSTRTESLLRSPCPTAW